MKVSLFHTLSLSLSLCRCVCVSVPFSLSLSLKYRSAAKLVSSELIDFGSLHLRLESNGKGGEESEMTTIHSELPFLLFLLLFLHNS